MWRQGSRGDSRASVVPRTRVDEERHGYVWEEVRDQGRVDLWRTGSEEGPEGRRRGRG